MSDIQVIRETADGYTTQGHAVTYTEAYVKFRKSFRRKALRMLKGAPLSVFLCVALSDEPPDVRTICDDTGWSTHSVCDALDFLVSRNFLEEVGRSGSHGVKVYIPRAFTWEGSDKNARPDADQLGPPRIAPNAIRQSQNAIRPIDDVDDHNFSYQRNLKPERGKSDHHSTSSRKEGGTGGEKHPREFLQRAGVNEPNLSRLSRKVRPGVAHLWLDWKDVASDEIKDPVRYMVKCLLENPEALPPVKLTEQLREAYALGRV